MPPTLADHWQARAVALAAVHAGARAALAHFRRPHLPVEWKSDDSPVTVADREAEAAIRQVVRDACPADAWLGEETGSDAGAGGPDGRASGRRWIVDPIDGTRNFVRGVPLWGVLVACEEDTPAGPRVVASAAAIPALGEVYDAVLGGGSRCNGTPIRVASTASLDQALWCFETLAWFRRQGLGRVFEALDQATGLQRGLGDAYAHLLVASGRAEVMVEPHLSVWDMAATSLIVTEAGGGFTDLDGRPSIRSGEALVSNGVLHPALLRLVAEHRDR